MEERVRVDGGNIRGHGKAHKGTGEWRPCRREEAVDRRGRGARTGKRGGRGGESGAGHAREEVREPKAPDMRGRRRKGSHGVPWGVRGHIAHMAALMVMSTVVRTARALVEQLGRRGMRGTLTPHLHLQGPVRCESQGV